MRELAVALGLPQLIAARCGLGTINHTQLTLEAARHVGLQGRAVVLTSRPSQPSILERSNRDTIQRMGVVEVQALPWIEAPDASALARAGSTLPWRRWMLDAQTRAL